MPGVKFGFSLTPSSKSRSSSSSSSSRSTSKNDEKKDYVVKSVLPYGRHSKPIEVRTNQLVNPEVINIYRWDEEFTGLYDSVENGRDKKRETLEKWEKWVNENFDPHTNKEELIKICGHYVLSNPDFLNNIKSRFPNIDNDIKNNINNKLKELYGC